MNNNKRKILAVIEKRNEGVKHANFELETSTYQPMLLRAIQLSEGPVLEIGSGIFSTPFLHWLCEPTQRLLFTVEHYQHYYNFAKKFETPWHKVSLISPKEQVQPSLHYGVVFIDHSPKRPRTRGDDTILFAQSADYVVLHDCGKNPEKKYGYEKAFPHFKYRHDWDHLFPGTTVLSNLKDLSNL